MSRTTAATSASAALSDARPVAVLRCAIRPGERFILIDGERLREQLAAAQRAVGFPERDGAYDGQPEDDDSAIREFERLRGTDIDYIVIAWPGFWWLDYLPRFAMHLRETCPCVLQNERLIIFSRRPALREERA